MAWRNVFSTWFRPRTVSAADRQTPILPDSSAAQVRAPAFLGPSEPVFDPRKRGTHLTIPLVGPSGMTLEQRQAAVHHALQSRPVQDVLREHQISIVDGGLASHSVHARAAALGLPEGKEPWMLTLVVQDPGGGCPTYNTHPRFREAVDRLYVAVAEGLRQSTGAAFTHDHRLFEMLDRKGANPMRLDEQEKTDAALRATLTLVRTLQGTSKPLPYRAADLADRLATYYGDATIDPYSGRASPPDARKIPTISSDARRDFLENARCVVQGIRAMGIADPQLDEAVAAMQAAGKDTTPPSYYEDRKKQDQFLVR
jgi:hypothetical protein